MTIEDAYCHKSKCVKSSNFTQTVLTNDTRQRDVINNQFKMNFLNNLVYYANQQIINYKYYPNDMPCEFTQFSGMILFLRNFTVLIIAAG